MAQMFDQIGGLGRLVRNKSVTMKINMTGRPSQRLGFYPAERIHWTHPRVIAVTCHEMFRAGAKRITLVESAWSTADPLEEVMLEANWDPKEFQSLGGPVEMINTNWLGRTRHYARFQTPKNGHMFAAYDLHEQYRDTDVFVSIAKLKEHETVGVTMTMKNLFGITPSTIYGDGAGEKEPSRLPSGGRGMIHGGYRTPSKSAPQPHENWGGLDAGGRVPRVVADLNAVRKVDLAIIDGIETLAGGEGPWNRPAAYVKASLLVVGTNAVNTDAVGAALMGFDPMADRGSAPFETSDNAMRLAEELGVGTRDLSRIEVIGGRIADWKSDMRSFRKRG
jgi:uncharacterized protein (DUF362 family)